MQMKNSELNISTLLLIKIIVINLIYSFCDKKSSISLCCIKMRMVFILFIVALWGWQLRAGDCINNQYQYTWQFTYDFLSCSGFWQIKFAPITLMCSLQFEMILLIDLEIVILM